MGKLKFNADTKIVLALIALTILGKFSSFGKEVVFAGLFGVSLATDAYFIATQLSGVIWLAIFFTIGSVFTPIYVRKMKDKFAAITFVNESIRFYSLLAIVLMFICWVFAENLTLFVAPSISDETLVLAIEYTRIMSIGFIFTGYVGIQSALQQANKQFIPPLAVPVINNAIAAIFIVIAYLFDDVAIAVIGAVMAYVFQAIIQRWQTLKIYKTQWGGQISRDTWQKLSLLSAPVILAVILDQLNIIIGTAIASGFGEGSISYLSYANRLTLLISGLFSWLVAYFFYPELAKNASDNDEAANTVILTRALGIIFITTAPMAAAALALRHDVISFIYQRGAFQSADVMATANLFGILGLGIIFMATRELMNRVYFSYQNTIAPLCIGLISAIINIISSLYLSSIYGIIGIAMGASISAAAFCIAQFTIIAFWKPMLINFNALCFAIASLIAAAIGYVGIISMKDITDKLPLILRLTVDSTILLAIYLPFFIGIMHVMGVKFAAIKSILYQKQPH